MKFLVDAQLPRRMAGWLRDQGHDALHTLDLPDRNRTTDEAITEIARQQRRIVVTKDADFVHSHNLLRQPQQLLLVSTGNIANRELEQILRANLDTVVAAFQQADFVEVSRTGVIIHD